MKNTNLLVIALLLAVLVPFVTAEVVRPDLVDYNKTLSFSDLGLSGPSEILIYSADPANDNRFVLVETGNTTAGILYEPVNDYHVVQKPSLSNRWASNPATLLTDAVGYLMNFALPLFIILGFCAILIGLAHMGRR